MRIKGSNQHNFAKAPQALLQRSKFNRSFSIKTTFDAGKIYPLFWDEILPGDTYKCDLKAFCRFSTLLFPLMDNVWCDVFYFFIPNRLVWDNWVRLCGEQDNPSDTTNYLVPNMVAPVGGYAEGSIYDYFGLPTKVAGFSHISLPLRSYNLTYNRWFRDENLINSVPVNKTDSIDPSTDYILRPRGKRKDYFTSGLPWPQKNNTGIPITVPLGSSAPVVTNNLNPTFTGGSGITNSLLAFTAAGSNPNVQIIGTATGAGNLIFGNQSGLIADLANATGATINSMRQAFQIQRMYERDARGGTRYQEVLVSHFKVHAPDQRLQYPEFLHQSSHYVNITAIPQSAPTGAYANTPQGNLAAIGTLAINDTGFTRSFVEHGILLCLISARADLTYQQGLNRMWSRSTRFDYFWPALAHLGEQAVLNKEIMAQGTAADNQVFAYQERYAEYRYYPGQITGLFRTNATGTLDSWHLAQSFATLPVLGATFINEDVPTSRVKAVPTEPDFLLDGRVDMICAREMPMYGVPGMIDHF